MVRNPFSAGRWVCGPDFFGRAPLIDDMIHSSEACNWIIGKRRMGKTSLLRQIERIVNTKLDNLFALFWDIQGSYDSQGLCDSLYDGIEDSQDSYPENWQRFSFEISDETSCPQLLKKLSRALGLTGAKLLLLMDETEELMGIGQQAPELLSKMRRFFQTNRNTRTIMTSSPRLEQLSTSVDTHTSPFLHGFSVAYLGNFTEPESRQLLSRGIDDSVNIDKIISLTDGNPFEIQLLGKHLVEEGSLETCLLQLETNPTLNQTIEVNFNLLNPEEQAILKGIHCGPAPFQDFEKAITAKLVKMGYLKQGQGSSPEISSYFQSKWLALNLLDFNEYSVEPTPADQAGIFMNPENAKSMLTRLVDLYRIFLEITQKGMRIARTDGNFNLTFRDGRLLLDNDHLELMEAKEDAEPWQAAISEIADFLGQYLSEDGNWSLFRFHQMAEKGVQHYTEKDFLDLMMLITEEAALD